MATASSGWKCTHTASITSQTDTTATIKVECYWQNDGWAYDINYVSAWVYCDGNSYKVMNSGTVDTTSSNTAKQLLGSHSFTVNKTTAAQSISCYGKITSESSYVSGTKSSTATNVSVSAKTSYTVSYNANGGSGAPSSQTKWHGTTLTLSSTKPTRSGYTFVGWGTSTTDTSANYSAGGSYTANASDTLYAIWKKTITLTYDANGGSGAPSSQNQTIYNATTNYKFTLSSTKPTRTGYTFLGWSTSNTATSSSYSAGGSITLSSSDTLYAVWSENSLTVNYYSNYATYGTFKGEVLNVSGETSIIVHTQTFLYDNEYGDGLANIQNTGYLFLSKTGHKPTGYWSAGNGILINQNTSFSTGKDVAIALGKDIASGSASANVYVQWEKNTYTLEYVANGGSGSMESQLVKWQETFSLYNNLFTREGYKFVGWNLYRNIDDKWYTTSNGWVSESEILANGYSKRLYENQQQLKIDNSWINGNESASLFKLRAIWEISGVVYIDNGASLEPYLAYIDNGANWELYIAYVDDGTNWKMIS